MKNFNPTTNYIFNLSPTYGYRRLQYSATLIPSISTFKTMPVSLMLSMHWFGVILFCEKCAWFKASPRRLQFILAGRVRMAG